MKIDIQEVYFYKKKDTRHKAVVDCVLSKTIDNDFSEDIATNKFRHK